MFFIAFCLITFTRQSYMTATHWAHVSAHSRHLPAAPGPASVLPAVPPVLTPCVRPDRTRSTAIPTG
jgi:hypothetical protein